MAGFLTALWLGVLASISPCPLATNIAAVSFIARKTAHPRSVLWCGIAYTVGRMLAYAVVGGAIIASVVSIPQASQFLQKYINKALGPILMITGLVLLDVVKISFPVFSISSKRQETLSSSGAAGSFALGFIFALAFCPVSAALFFGSLMPLALKQAGGALLPFVFGAGSALPAAVFAVMFALGIGTVAGFFHVVTRIEYFARRATGAVFVAVGAYYAWAYIILSIF